MVPARIWKGDYCLVSPCAQLQVDQRAWFRHPSGRETIRWVMQISAAGYDLAAWDLDEVGHQDPTAAHRNREDVVERGAVLAGVPRKPSLTKHLPPVADWRPDPLAELWRSSLLSNALKKVYDDLNQTVSMVEEIEMRIKRLAQQGAISDLHADQLLRGSTTGCGPPCERFAPRSSETSPTGAVARPHGDAMQESAWIDTGRNGCPVSGASRVVAADWGGSTI